MSLTPGASVGQYRIQSLLGVGGMGEVYRARDTRLNRDVALKILPASVAADPDRLARFRREAQLLASLNHPHIAQIYGIEEDAAVRGLVLELVEGETLAARLLKGPMSLAEAVACARQIADGLDAAHDKSIVHRDLKPANIKIAPDGTVKLLDFGLAKAVEGDESLHDVSHSPTITNVATRSGMILGTAPYMSPEQARGLTVDRRTDLWAFGLVLFEMLTGHAAFAGDNVTDVLAHVLTREPDWSRLPPTTPPVIRALLLRCLAKDRRERLDSAAAARFALEDAVTTAAPAAVAQTPALRWFPWAAGLAVGATIAAAATWWLMRSPDAAPAQLVRFTIVPPIERPLAVSVARRSVAISPDGRYIAHLSGSDPQYGVPIVRRLDQLEGQPVTDAAAAEVFFSPDSQWLGFIDDRGNLKKVSVSGGPVTLVAPDLGIPGGASWGDDDRISYTTLDAATGVMAVPASGGTPTVLSRPDAAKGELDHAYTSALPRGRGILTTVVRKSAAEPDIAVLNAADGSFKVLFAGNTPAYIAQPTASGTHGLIVYGLGGRLQAVRFNLDRLETIGDPVTLVEGVQRNRNGRTHFALAQNGTLVYIPAGAEEAALHPRSLVWVDRTGTSTPIPAPARAYGVVTVSPDGRFAALEVLDQESDIWVMELASGALRRLTFGPSIEQMPVWTSDSRQLVYMSNRDNRVFNIYRQSADGSGEPERLTMSGYQQFPQSVTPDGTAVVGFEYRVQRPELVLWPLPLAPGAEGKSILKSTGAVEAGALSPNGKFLAYQSDETGRHEVYVRPFPNLEAGRWQVSASGGSSPSWSSNGRELYYRDQTRALMAVPTDTATAFKAGSAVTLFDTSLGSSAGSYAPHPDGSRFLMTTDAPPDPKAPRAGLVVVLNWAQELTNVFGASR